MSHTDEEAEIMALAIKDMDCHKRHGVDLNPFSTQTARLMWSMGWDMKKPAIQWNWRAWERGRQARILENQEAGTA